MGGGERSSARALAARMRVAPRSSGVVRERPVRRKSAEAARTGSAM